MRAILINPQNQTITEVEVPEANPGMDHLRAIYKHLDCKTITAVRLDPNADMSGDIVYLDDEGLYSGKNSFRLEGHTQSYVGQGIVFGTLRDGDDTQPKATLEEVVRRVTHWGILIPDPVSDLVQGGVN